MNEAQNRVVLIANPRGFCAGVERAIDVVRKLLESHGTPLYVRKEIVHNKAVVEDFRKRGVIFIEELDEVPDGATVVFSAHGIAPAVRQEAQERGLRTIDATCPLVTKVHRSVRRHAEKDRIVVLIGHAGHDEVVGTMGEAQENVVLIETEKDVARLDIPEDRNIAYVTQTTLSVDETKTIVEALKARYPQLVVPARSDICYATQNRQDAVKALVAEGASHVLVVGSRNSSNSVRLCEVARSRGAEATLVDGPEEVDIERLAGHARLGLTAGASAPEHLVQAVAERLQAAGWQLRGVTTLQEDVRFTLPKELAEFGVFD